MAISYNWTCTACGATNAAGTDICRQCGSKAITSAFEIEAGVNSKRRPPLSTAKKIILVCSVTAMFVGVFLVRVFSNATLFLAGLSLIAVGLIVAGVARGLPTSLRRVQ
jgi:hypothetical protein